MDLFEELLSKHSPLVERYVKFRLPEVADKEDVIQEIYFSAFKNFGQLKNINSFKPWIIGIAINKCNDWYKANAKKSEIPIDSVEESKLIYGRYGLTESNEVKETLDLMKDKYRQILDLYFIKEMQQKDISKYLSIPLGTVKSRIYKAKHEFKKIYPHHPDSKKGEINMKIIPGILPEYKIEYSDKKPFNVKWEELMGWFLVPKLGEKITWGMYDIPSRKCNHIYDMKVTGKAMVHGIEGVELTAREANYSEKKEAIYRTFVAQLTDTHCRYLATLRNDGDVRNYITFLDGDEFMLNWGFGEDNCGNETNLSVKGDIQRVGNSVTSANKDFLLDIVGRYTVTIGGKSYDTVCVMDIETYNCGVVSEQFLDKDGKTILWRRYNRDDWAIDRYKKPWSEQLPENDRLIVNGTTYVHWYDCITDHIL